MLKRFGLAALVAVTASLTTTPLRAEDAPPAPPPTPTADAGGQATKGKTDAVAKPDGSKRAEGWSPGIAFGGTVNLVDTRSVVGQMDGTTLMLGAALDASLEFNTGMHEWRNSLRAGAGVSRTPALDEFVKTADGLDFESIYLLHVLEIFGPYARVALRSQMFPGVDIRPAAVSYSVANLDGTTTDYVGRRLAMTDAFKPLTFKESLGAFLQPLKQDQITLEGRAGLGAQETLAEGNLALNDDAATPQIEVKALDDFYQIGAEAIVNAWGFIDETKRVSYTVGAGVLVPFATSELPPGDDRSLPELTNVEGILGLNVKLFDWASLGYRLNVLREPLLVDQWQVSNNLLLTIGAAFGTKAPAPPPPPPCDCAAKAEPAPAPTPATPVNP